ncbi:MAG TPA: serine/threonine protein kinase, partial [Myxococcus sp.]|nr:serine/threonine protein kinase [Myxococcus sp.]
MMTTQACPNCGLPHDIRVYVSGQKVSCRCGIRFEARRGDVAGSKAPGLSGISRADGASQRNTVVPGASGEIARNGVTVERGSGVQASVMTSSDAAAPAGVGTAITVVPGGRALAGNGAPSNGVAVLLPGVPAPAVAASGVALPAAAVPAEAVEATMVRSSVGTSTGSEHSNLDLNASVSTFVGAGKVDLPGFELLEMLGRGGMGEV